MNHINVKFVDERKKYVEEVLAHQFEQLPSLPVQATHLVFVYDGSNNREDQRKEQSDFQKELAKQLHLSNISLESQISGEARYEGTVNNMQYRLRWEEHSAFFAYTFLRFGESTLPAVDCLQGIVTDSIPFPGKLLAAIDIRLENERSEKNKIADVLRCSDKELYGSLMSNGLAEVWSSMKIPKINDKIILLHEQSQSNDSDFNRILIQYPETNNSEHDSAAVGRLLDMIIELETYRTLSSYDLSESESRKILETVETLEKGMQERIKEIGRPGNPFYYCRKLNELADSWFEIEQLISENTSKLAKADAYDDLVNWYLDMLNEENISGQQVTKIGLPMRRMIKRSKHACQTIEKRLEYLSQHVDRTSDLLRTRMDVSFQFMATPLAIIVASYYVLELFTKLVNPVVQNNPIILTLFSVSLKLSQLVEILVIISFSFSYLWVQRFYRSWIRSRKARKYLSQKLKSNRSHFTE